MSNATLIKTFTSFHDTFYKLLCIPNNLIFVYVIEDVKLVDEVVSSLENSGLICAAGIATSLIESGQQW